MSTLDNLKKEAKRWLKALRAGDAAARTRYARAYPHGPDDPGLRDIQHALAREHGHRDWKAFTAAIPAGGPPATPLQELLHAADRQDAARVAEILAAHPDLVNQRGRLPGHTGLRTALHFGVHNEAVVRTLLDRGADPNIRDEGDNAIPLHFAAEREELPIIRVLVEQGSDVIGHGDGHGLDVIGWATCFGKAREDVVKYLLAHGAKHNIFSAVATNDLDAIRALAADSRAAIDMPMDATNRRRRPLHLAVVRKKPEALDLLLELGADIEARDEAGLTPLDQAAIDGETAMADRLMARGARVDLPAAIGLQRPADIERLLREDPGCLKPGRRWGTLIVTAAERATGSIMETLLRAGASVNVKADPRTAVDETEGYTALHAAAWHANRPAVEVLLSHGADSNAKDSKYDATPAGWADYAGHHQIRDLILGRSAVSASIVRTFLEFACWDHHTHGKGDHRMADRAAQRILAQHPDLATHSLYTAIVCGNLKEVRRLLAERPEAAREPGGSRGWTPLLYLSYTRFTHPPTLEHAVEIASLLLDYGANPNDFYMAGDSEYTCLVGAAGEGEQDSPRQPYAAALYRLLLERGAKPYDIQVLYNTHFSGDILWWLELTYEHSLKTGRKADWDDPQWSMFGMGGYGSGNYFVLKVALDNEDLTLAEWALSHGAGPNVDTARAHRKFKPQRTLYDEAVLRGATEFADLLRRHGATSAGATLDDEQLFAAACLRLDREAARALVEKHPEYLRSHRAMFEAAQRDRPDVIELLLDLGVPIEVADGHNTRALHQAAGNNALRAAQFLIDRGAEIDPRETAYGGAPIGWAAHGDNQEMLDLLSRYSKNIWTLCFRGYVDRVRDILREDPSLARQVSAEGITPLWWLPDDDEKAMAIVELLLAAGADAGVKNREGHTAADWARRRGMAAIARRLVAAGASEDHATIEPPPDFADVSRYESLVEDLVVAYETGNPAAMRRLMRHFGGDVTWEQLRTAARQRLKEIGRSGPDESAFGVPQARELIARQSGFDDWTALEASLAAGVKKDGMSPVTTPIVYPPPEPADVPIEMRSGFIQRLRDNTGVPTAEIWSLLMACRDGDLARVEALLTAWPTAVVADYNYMTPIHLAVREGHTAIVRYLAERGAVNPKYRTYPYNEPLRMLATDRGYEAIAAMLDEYGRNVDPDRPEEEGGHIEYVTDFERQRFQRLVSANALEDVEEMLERRAELATDPFAFWSEGVLSMPSNRGDLKMIALLMRFGARVPTMTKWAAEYYFKHDDIAALLLERGMSARHANCHRTTLLHEMARRGALVRARLLLDHGAEIDAVDEEFKSTPLGFATRWGQRAMVRLLLDRGADRRLAGADWATPLAWARRKGHGLIGADLG